MFPGTVVSIVQETRGQKLCNCEDREDNSSLKKKVMIGVARKQTGEIRQALKEGRQEVLRRRMPQARGLPYVFEQQWWLGGWRVWGEEKISWLSFCLLSWIEQALGCCALANSKLGSL